MPVPPGAYLSEIAGTWAQRRSPWPLSQKGSRPEDRGAPKWSEQTWLGPPQASLERSVPGQQPSPPAGGTSSHLRAGSQASLVLVPGAQHWAGRDVEANPAHHWAEVRESHF